MAKALGSGPRDRRFKSDHPDHMNKIKIRAHHFLCIEGFKGLGYSKDFIENMKKVILKLKKEKSAIVVKTVDDICSKCPYLCNRKCQNPYGRNVIEMDKNVIKKLGLKENDEINYSILKRRIYTVFKKKIDLYEICDKCGWKSVCDFYLTRQ
jgi:hypothetical protein